MADVITLAGQFGPMGLLVGYIIWRDLRDDDQRMKYDEARLECDKRLAGAMATLAAVIQGRP